jgi:hypothetical protein
LIAAILAVGSHYSYLKTTLDYSKHTIRGKSELTTNQNNQTSGLDRDYITQWSYGIDETLTLLVPNFKGGESGRIGENETALKNIPSRQKGLVSQMNSYWGDQPFTAGPVYVGAFLLLLFLFGIFVVKDRIKIGLLIVLVVTVMLSWGKNLMGFTDFFLDYFPGYNKFRAVSSILVIAEFIIPLIGILALQRILKEKDFFSSNLTILGKEQKITHENLFLSIAAVLIFFTAILWLMPGMLTSFFATGEYEMMMMQLRQSGFPESEAIAAMAALETARKNILSADALRTLVILAIGTGMVYAFIKIKFRPLFLTLGIAALIFGDLWTVNLRYMGSENFIEKKIAERDNFKKTVADEFILRDSDLHYRVANIATSTFNDATTSYFHKSIGGYHGAKLRRYQELIDARIQREIQSIIGVLQRNPTPENVDSVFKNAYALSMLNTKYVIYNSEAPPLPNKYTMGNAWFVKDLKFVKNADEEIASLQNINSANIALVDERFKDATGSNNFDENANIELVKYHPDVMEYKYSSAKPGNVLFSEIYYSDGWNAYIDGNLVPHYRANYVLRGLSVPEGEHNITFKFEPSYHSDERVSLIFSALLLLMFAGFSYLEFKKKD